MMCPAREALFGGAAGPGKSWALLMAALEFVDLPGYHALLMRGTYPELTQPNGLITLADEWLSDTDAHWDDEKHEWEFPNGSTLGFGYMKTARDKYRYKGGEYQFVGYDELTAFTEEQYLYLFSRQRKPKDSLIPLRMRATSNPGDIGHEWVRDRFVEPGSPQRPFFPARLGDNPYLDVEGYMKSLDELDPITRRQLLHGDWGARPAGGWFDRDQIEVVDTAPVIRKAIRYWDFAASVAKPNTDPDWTVGALLGFGSDRNYYVLDVNRFQQAPAFTEQALRHTATRIDSGYRAEIWLEQEPGSNAIIAMDHIVRDVLPGHPVFVEKKSTSKQDRARPLSAMAARGALKMLRAPWNRALLDELEAFPTPRVHDDQVDALSGAFAKLVDSGVFAMSGNDQGGNMSGWDGYTVENPLGVA